jgi:hypothetical protein
MTEGTSTSKPTPIAAILRRLINKGNEWLSKPKLHRDVLAIWIDSIRSHLEKIYGTGAPQLAHFSKIPLDLSEPSLHNELRRRVEQVQRMVENLEAIPRASESPLAGKRIFIGHGRSPCGELSRTSWPNGFAYRGMSLIVNL